MLTIAELPNALCTMLVGLLWCLASCSSASPAAVSTEVADSTSETDGLLADVPADAMNMPACVTLVQPEQWTFCISCKEVPSDKYCTRQSFAVQGSISWFSNPALDRFAVVVSDYGTFYLGSRIIGCTPMRSVECEVPSTSSLPPGIGYDGTLLLGVQREVFLWSNTTWPIVVDWSSGQPNPRALAPWGPKVRASNSDAYVHVLFVDDLGRSVFHYYEASGPDWVQHDATLATTPGTTQLYQPAGAVGWGGFDFATGQTREGKQLLAQELPGQHYQVFSWDAASGAFNAAELGDTSYFLPAPGHTIIEQDDHALWMTWKEPAIEKGVPNTWTLGTKASGQYDFVATPLKLHELRIAELRFGFFDPGGPGGLMSAVEPSGGGTVLVAAYFSKNQPDAWQQALYPWFTMCGRHVATGANWCRNMDHLMPAPNLGPVALTDAMGLQRGWRLAIQTEAHFSVVARINEFGDMVSDPPSTCDKLSLGYCADTNPCTNDLCDGDHGGCFHVPLPDGLTCSSAGGKCSGGACL